MNASPTYIGPYKVLRKIGEGGMGQVHECSTAGGSRVAVKTIKPEYRDYPEVQERFRSEIATSKAVRGPYVADYFDSDGDELWLATRYYPWPSIRNHVSEHGPLSVEETAELAGRVAEALHNIHAAGRVHRDLSPANILYLEGDVRVIDYGISKDLSITHGAGITGNRPAPYTWRYASPEHIAGRQVSEQSDYFSLGCVLTYAATGLEFLDDLRVKRPEIVPDVLRPLVVALTQEDPGLRPEYQVILEWTAALGAAAAGSDDRLATRTTPHPYRLAVARLLHGRLDLFSTDNQPGRILHRWRSEARDWSSWDSIHLPGRHSDKVPQHLAVATRSSGTSDLFVVLDNGILLHNSYRPGSGWSGWADLARDLSGRPIAAAASGDNDLDLFTADRQGHLLHRWNRNNQGWSGWSYMAPPAVNHPAIRLSDGGHGWTVTHVAAAGTPAGDRHLVVGLDNQALAYSAQRQQDGWSEWVWVSASPLACATLSADEGGARGAVADLDREGDQFFFEHWHGWKRPWDDFEDVLAERLHEPWAGRTIVDLASSSSGDGTWDLFALLDDGAVLHRTDSMSGWQALDTPVQGSRTLLPGATDKTYRIPPLPPTTPLTDTEE